MRKEPEVMDHHGCRVFGHNVCNYCWFPFGVVSSVQRFRTEALCPGVIGSPVVVLDLWCRIR